MSRTHRTNEHTRKEPGNACGAHNPLTDGAHRKDVAKVMETLI